MSYFVYMVACADCTLYTGIARDVEKRVQEHNEGQRGAKYTKVRRPVTLVYTEPAVDRSAALKQEHALRQLTRGQKQALIAEQRVKSG